MATPRTWVVGEVVTAALMNAEIRDQLNALITLQPISAVKSADTGRASTTSLAADPHLVLAVAASATYLLDGWLEYDGAFGAGDLKADWSLPSGATIRWGLHANASGDTTQKYATTTGPAATALTAGTYGVGAVANAARPAGFLTIGATAGNATFRWAQNSSNGTATTLRAGSWLRIFRRT